MKAFGGPPGDGSVKGLVSSLARENTRLRETQSRMKDLRGTGRSADERVRVEVDRFGALVGLKIDPRAMRLGSEALTEAILHAAEQGVRDVKAQADAMMRPLVEELTGTTEADPGGAEFAGWEPKDVLAALRDVRRDLL
jgi:DNA-binding protein YbaB